jgi:YtkA-like
MTAAPALVSLATLWLCMCATGQASAQGRAKAEVSCRPAGAELEYDCVIRLTDAHGKAPVAGATITVGADMPSMPMAHNIRPVEAAPTADPGVYEVRLKLEMHGDWALRIEVRAPVRDRVIVPLRFDDKAVRPPDPSRAAPHRGH